MSALTAEKKAAMRAGRDRHYAREAAAAADVLESRGRAGDVGAAAALRQHGQAKLAAKALGMSRPGLQARIASARREAARYVTRPGSLPSGPLADLVRALQIAADGGDPGRALLAEIARSLGIVPRVR